MMTQDATADIHLPAPERKRYLVSLVLLATTGIVMLAWISGLVWGAMAFFSWLVS
jgi:hypothetical protein